MTQVTAHQTAWWGSQPCRDCNPAGLPAREAGVAEGVLCDNPECLGTGWTVWASLCKEPWTEIISGLWIGGLDHYLDTIRHPNGDVEHTVGSAAPGVLFDVVVSAYDRPDCEPHHSVEHHRVLMPDAALTPAMEEQAVQAAHLVADRLKVGGRVLVRCQAGLNRSSLIAGIAMTLLGHEGTDAVQLIRARRSPWALCNQEFADYLSGLSAGGPTVSVNTRGGTEQQDDGTRLRPA